MENTKRKVTIFIVLSLLIVFGSNYQVVLSGSVNQIQEETIVAPEENHLEADWHPGANGQPPNITPYDSSSWEVDYEALYSSSGENLPLPMGYDYYGVVTDTEFSREIRLLGPSWWTFLDRSSEYVVSTDLTIEKVESYCPVFYLEREPWYNHKLSLDTSLSETFSVSVGGTIGAGYSDSGTGLYGDVSVSGSYTITSEMEYSTGWSVILDDTKNPVNGVANYMVVYLLCTFLHVYGSVDYYYEDGGDSHYSRIDYDAIMLQKMSLTQTHTEVNGPDLPVLEGADYIDENGDGADRISDLTDYRYFSYSRFEKTTWSVGFELSLGKKSTKEGTLAPWNFGFDLGVEWTGSTELETQVRHEFIPNDEPAGYYFMDSGSTPRSLDYFLVRTDGFLNVNLETHHDGTLMPTAPDLFFDGGVVPSEIDESTEYEFSIQSYYNPTVEEVESGVLTNFTGYSDLYYLVEWGDGRYQYLPFTPQGDFATGTISFSPGKYDIKITAFSWYGDSSSSYTHITVLDIDPYRPDRPSGPESGYLDSTYEFSFVTTDAHGYDIQYEIDWGDDTVSTTEFVPSGTEVTLSHSWSFAAMSGTNYDVRVRAQNDYFGVWSDWSDSLQITISRSTPNTPDVGGPSSLLIETSGSFWAEAVEPLGLQVKYTLHWSDDTSWTSDWVDSGTRVTKTHTFGSACQGSFWADVTNEHGVTSTSEILLVTVYNTAPGTPDAPSGLSFAYKDKSYTCTVQADDADGHSVKYEIDWGDGTTTVTDFYDSGTEVTVQHSWSTCDTFDVKVRAQDSYDAWSSWSDTRSVTVSESTPNVPDFGGPSSLLVGTSGSFWAQTTDPAGCQVKYTIYWDDGTSWTSDWVDSGTKVTKSHSFSSTGIKSYWVKATNTYGETSTSDPKTLSVTNSAPNTPSRPSGPSSGVTDQYYSFSFVTTDPNGHNVRYQIDWGDGSTTTTGYYSSGSTVSRSHKWTTSVLGGMYYYVKVRAQDSYGAWSSWSSKKAIYITPSGGGGPIICGQPSLVNNNPDIGSLAEFTLSGQTNSVGTLWEFRN